MPNITTEKTKLSVAGHDVAAFIARPEGATAAPAIIIIHEWWGLTAHIEDIAQRYARAGFIAVAADLFHGTTTKDAQEAEQLMKELKPEDGMDSLRVVLRHLRAMPEVTAVGVTGFCMGGTFALRLACEEQLDAAAPFYGDVPSDTTFIQKLSCPVLFVGGARDQWITVEKLERLRAALAQYGKAGEVKIYDDADHAFFNDTRPEVYNAADAADAWARVVEFFNRCLRKGQVASA